MTRLFEDRERAAETGFAHEEKLRFLATRTGIMALAGWAAARIRLDETGTLAYTDALLGAFVGGRTEAEILVDVRADLARAGLAGTRLGDEAGAVLSQAIAEATTALHGTREVAPQAESARAPQHRPHAFWGWTV